jgi:hypothetical protein
VSLALLALMLATAQTGPAQNGATMAPPGNILFGFYRMKVFRDRSDDLHCDGNEKRAADAEMDVIQKRLIMRYGKQAFSPPRSAPSGPGDCHVAMMVYRANLNDYRKLVDATLAETAPTIKDQE